MVFFNEVGVGFVAIVYFVVRIDEFICEGLVVLLELFIDIIVVCNMIVLVIVIIKVYNVEEFFVLWEVNKGVELIFAVFGIVLVWFLVLLAIVVFCFVFFIMIFWSYYGECCWDYLFGGKGLIIYKILFLIVIFVGLVFNLFFVINFSDVILFLMVFFNILGGYFLCSLVVKDL